MESSKKHILLRYLVYAKPYRWTIVLMVGAGIAKFTLPLIPAHIFRVIIDQVIDNPESHSIAERHSLLLWLGLILLGATVLEAVAFYLRGLSIVKVSSSIAFDLRGDLWKHLQRLSLAFHRSWPTGTLLSRLINDIAVSQQMINGGIVNVVIDGISGIAALAVLLAISWKLTLLVLAVLPAYGLLYHKINPQIRQASRDVQEQTSVISGTATERLNGIALVKSFAQEPAETHYFAAQADELRTLAVRRGKLNNTLKAIAQMLIAIGGYMVMIVGGYMAIDGNITSGQIVQFIAVASLLYLPMQRFSQINIVYQTSMAGIERVFAIFDMVPEVQNRPDIPDRTVEKGNIRFDKVKFRYGDGPEVLKDVSFTLEPGQRVAMVGESGAGKSTVATLISRLYDVTEGAILIDGIDIRDYPLHNLRRSTGIVLQDTILFSGTISENLRYGRKEASEEEIIAAAKSANIDSFISSLPEGYDSRIGERGLTLSGGQRQRISLARTILQNPRILILDEATSSLDSESENLITEALERVMVGRACLIIAHRLSTIIKADCILVLKEGRIVEQGPHEQLLATSGYYQYLFEQQFAPIRERNSL